jgi:hypothetical protein
MMVPDRPPTVALGGTSAVVSGCGHERGHIEHRVGQSLTGHGATRAGPAARPPPRPPPPAPPLASGRQHPGRRPRLPLRGRTAHTPPSDAGHPWGRLREEPRHHRSRVPREAMPRSRTSEGRGGRTDKANRLLGYCWALGAHLSAAHFPGAAQTAVLFRLLAIASLDWMTYASYG